VWWRGRSGNHGKQWRGARLRGGAQVFDPPLPEGIRSRPWMAWRRAIRVPLAAKGVLWRRLPAFSRRAVGVGRTIQVVVPTMRPVPCPPTPGMRSVSARK
jgi:hypothetical protein